MPWNVSTVETTNGTKVIEDLGKILPHEHICVNVTNQYRPPPKNLKRYLDGEITLKNISYVREFPLSCKTNLQLNKVRYANTIKEMNAFYKNDGRTIVECTSYGFGDRFPPAWVELTSCNDTGVNFILGTGFASASMQNASTLNMTQEQIYDVMRRDLQSGFMNLPNIKAGFIGEISCDTPLLEFDKNSICAVGELQEQLKCSVAISVSKNKEETENILRIYKESGGKENKVALCHLDRTYHGNSELIDYLATTECFLSFDQFGSNNLHCQSAKPIGGKTALSDAGRIKLLYNLIKTKGKDFPIGRFLLSQDIHTKHKLEYYGGHGYSHIYKNIVPILKQLGFTDDDIETLTIENPQSWLRA